MADELEAYARELIARARKLQRMARGGAGGGGGRPERGERSEARGEGARPHAEAEEGGTRRPRRSASSPPWAPQTRKRKG